MPRPHRIAATDSPFHVVNRGNDRRTVFAETADYQRFIGLLSDGCERAPISIQAYCIMPNHFHLLLVPRSDAALSAYMHWVTGRYACYFRARTGTNGHGHVFQRRYWSHAVTNVWHYLAVARYVEGNARRARLVARAEDWRWGSLWERLRGRRRVLDTPLVSLPIDWKELVNAGLTNVELGELRAPVRRGRPRIRY
jgi:putative transposase